MKRRGSLYYLTNYSEEENCVAQHFAHHINCYSGVLLLSHEVESHQENHKKRKFIETRGNSDQKTNKKLIFQNYSKFFRIFQNYSEFFRIFQNYSKLFRIFQNYSEFFIIAKAI